MIIIIVIIIIIIIIIIIVIIIIITIVITLLPCGAVYCSVQGCTRHSSLCWLKALSLLCSLS